MLAFVSRHGAEAIELAPNAVWPEPIDASKRERVEFKNRVTGNGLAISGFHALLFTRPDLSLFRDRDASRAYADYLVALAELAVDLDAPVMVLGSPRNRARGRLGVGDAFHWAVEVFRNVAERIEKVGAVELCVEPLPPAETDFISSSDEGRALVDAVDHPRFGLMLDSKALFESGEDITAAIHRQDGRISHFHISNPGLGPIYDGAIDHQMLATELTAIGYNQYVAIEMRRIQNGNDDHVRLALDYARQCYIGNGV